MRRAILRRALPATATAAAIAVAVGACGGSEESQDANEPEGNFEVEVVSSEFPVEQRLAQTSDLVLEVENTGTETVPELAFTITTDDGGADGSFKTRSEQPGLANPNQSVWILENKFPRIKGDPAPKGVSPGLRAQTNTFGFGPLPPGESREVIWKVTPVQAGTYTLNYQIAAGLDGKAKAVTASGDEVKGSFNVTITDKPPQARVNDAGDVVVD